ncbi:MAG TPA: tRNA (adenosine(37)-N6)-threonylcarbamoyltransferase complex dimerization subunit type 1 TsaB [Solirubrobacteraceae bacterium]|nr:tRNA (adenosine(37)-N6)-threonylcarbamoyltransferase complex dimerization subunit type 1 TsaB [Solirubrobacteraceae bacterium]
MRILGLDTATPATAAALMLPGGELFEARDDPPAGGRPQHAQRLLELSAGLLQQAGLRFADLDLIAAGRGPGSYTGLRIALATARGIARGADARLVGVSTLRALAEPLGEQPVAAIIDARRGEAFVGVYRGAQTLEAPSVCVPEQLAATVLRGGPGCLAVGDGALRFSELLERAGVDVAAAQSDLHRLRAGAICRLAAAGVSTAAEPEYLRVPDAERTAN